MKRVKNEILFFDSHILEALLKNAPSSDFRRNYNQFFSQHLQREGVIYKYLTTPFLSLELLGLTKEHFGEPAAYKAPKHLTPFEQMLAAEQHGREHYLRQKCLTSDELKQKLELQAKNYSQDLEAQELAKDTIFRAVMHEGFSETLIAYLANRYAQRGELYSNFFEVAPSILFSALGNRAEGTDIAVYQTMHDNFYEFRRLAMNSKDISEEEKNFFKNVRLPEFKSHSDYLDAEIIHYAIMGLNENGRFQVTAVTGDGNPEKTYHRIYWAKNLYRYVLGWLHYKKSEFFLNPHYGKVFCIDRLTCEVKKPINIKKIPLFLHGDGAVGI